MLTLLAVEGQIFQNIGYVDCVSFFYRLGYYFMNGCSLDLVYPIFEKETLNISAKNNEFTSAIPQQIFVNSKVRTPAKPSAMTMTFFQMIAFSKYFFSGTALSRFILVVDFI